MAARQRKTSRAAFLALVGLLVLSLAPPAGASDSTGTIRAKREAARQKRAKLAAELNHLRASDAQLTSAVKILDRQVAAQQAGADAARQAVSAALAAVAESEAKIAATETEMTTLHTAVVNRAVSVYVRPKDNALVGVIGAKDLGDASRRSSLLAQVTNKDRDVLDRLRALREDLGDEKVKADAARDVAAQRRQVVLARLSELQKARKEKQRLSAALDARIREYQAEADAVAQQESGLTALIRSRESSRASRGDAVDPGPDGRISGAGLSWPIRGPVTSGFGTRWGRLHAGIDIGAGTGTPIRAAKAGDVIFAGVMSGYGNVVIIDHGGGLSTLYAHQSRLGTSDGTSVAQGDVIGYVGSTGHSTGPHLHFETRVGGSPQNPMRYLP
ncbi:MAG TPA: peptidoglycan DD-metalloendopeptidase family protein [Acidimicrobiales bacterium]|nr:peptidoglycan DD-metalloendopeptidase family protein [Acidimicrobiales bacterium]